MDADRYPDAKARALKQLWIMFKSLSTRIPLSSLPQSIESGVASMSTTEDDLMDVMCLIQPNDPCIMPAPIEELRPHAKRILSSSTPYDYTSIPRGEFVSLLKLLLCIQLDKPNLASGVHTTAHVLPTVELDLLDPLAVALLENSIPNEEGVVYWHDFDKIISKYLVRCLHIHEYIVSLLTMK